jgi:hypothetical protein
MKLSKLITNIKEEIPVQGKRKQNLEALKCLVNLGYDFPEIRKAPLDLNNVTMTEIANNEVSLPTVSNTIRGVRTNKVIQQKIAEILSLQVDEVFPN